MTLTEFYKYNETKSMPCDWIGQGSGYKIDKDWEEINNDEIIYIPEFGYDKDGTVNRENAFSKRDFREVVKEAYSKLKGADLDYVASLLFFAVDWQFPTTAVDEEWLLSDDDKERLGLED